MPDSSKQEKEKEIHKEEEELTEEVPAEPEYIQLKTKPIPAIVVLSGALVSAVYTFYQHIPFIQALLCILFTIIVFMILGSVAKGILDEIKIPVPVDEPEEDEELQENEELDEEETEESEEV